MVYPEKTHHHQRLDDHGVFAILVKVDEGLKCCVSRKETRIAARGYPAHLELPHALASVRKRSIDNEETRASTHKQDAAQEEPNHNGYRNGPVLMVSQCVAGERPPEEAEPTISKLLGTEKPAGMREEPVEDAYCLGIESTHILHDEARTERQDYLVSDQNKGMGWDRVSSRSDQVEPCSVPMSVSRMGARPQADR